eukprot:SAG25_NODE_2729_length_1419_cov_1.384848_2_plen_115_part_01
MPALRAAPPAAGTVGERWAGEGQFSARRAVRSRRGFALCAVLLLLLLLLLMFALLCVQWCVRVHCAGGRGDGVSVFACAGEFCADRASWSGARHWWRGACAVAYDNISYFRYNCF